MPRRDVVFTGLIAFGAGVAVGANWGKLRKKIGPLLEKLGLQMADLGDFLSAAGVEEFDVEAVEAEIKSRRPRASARSKAKPVRAGKPVASRRKGQRAGFATAQPAPKRKAPRRRPVVLEAEIPLATGTFGA